MLYTYESILAKVTANGDNTSGTETTAWTGTITIDLKPYQDQILKLDFKEFKDTRLASEVTATTVSPTIETLLGITKQGINQYKPDADGGSAFITGDRVVINAKKDYAMMFGKKGIAIASPNQVNIDAGKSITLFAHEDKGVFLGLPNKGSAITPALVGGKTKGDPTPDQLYEPLILGLKLANLLEDFLIVLSNAELASAISIAKWQPSTQGEFALLANRIPEILSTYAYVDGISHEEIDTESLDKLKAAQKKAKNYVPPTSIEAVVEGTFVDANASGVQSITKDIKDYNTIVATVIAKLEGGYWHPAMYLNGRLKPDGYYGKSGETMMGIDRYAGEGLRDTPAGKQFWSLIDNAVPPVGTPWIRPGREYKTINLQSLSGAAQTWKWLYRGGPLEGQLQALAGQMIKINYESYTKSYMNAQTSALVATDGRLMFHFIYACWNGPGWFQKFANDMDKAVASGITNTDELCKVALNSRTKEGLNVGSSPNALITKGGVKIAVIIGVPIP